MHVVGFKSMDSELQVRCSIPIEPLYVSVDKNLGYFPHSSFKKKKNCQPIPPQRLQ